MPDDRDDDQPSGDPADGEPTGPNLDAWIDDWKAGQEAEQQDEVAEPVVDQLTDVVVTSYGSESSQPLENPDEGAGSGEALEDLPGLEPDEADSDQSDPAESAPTEQPNSTPRTEAAQAATAPEPERYGRGDEQWTNEELDDWYENEFRHDLREGRVPTEVSGDLFDEYKGLEKWKTKLVTGPDFDDDSQEGLLSRAFLSDDVEVTWATLDGRMKASVRTRMEQARAERVAPDAPPVLHTMAGNAGEMLESPEVAAGFGGFKKIVIGGVAAAAAVAIALFAFGGGDDGPTNEGDGAGGSADSPVATASGADSGGDGGSGGTPEAPVIVRPCDVLDVELVSEALGPSVVTDRGGDGRRDSDCEYESDGGVTLSLLVKRNSAPRSGVFRSFESVNDAGVGRVVTTRTLDWVDEGEVRVTEVGTSRSKAALLAYVLTTDPLGRDIYVWITATGPPGDGIALGATIETMAELLRDAVLEAQP
jgi:hypothetical protein